MRNPCPTQTGGLMSEGLCARLGGSGRPGLDELVLGGGYVVLRLRRV